MRIAASWLAMAVLTAACGGKVVFDGAPDGTGGGGGGSSCPLQPPADGAACSGGQCSYTSNGCQLVFTCTNGAWSEQNNCQTTAAGGG